MSNPGKLFHFFDVDGDRLAVYRARIPDVGFGVNFVTDPNGSSLPDSEIPALIKVLQDYLSLRKEEEKDESVRVGGRAGGLHIGNGSSNSTLPGGGTGSVWPADS